MSETRVLALVGSLRADSVNRKLVQAVQEEAPAGVTVEIAQGLEHVPFYNEDLDGDAAPAPAQALREQIAAADRVLLVVPEYNGTMPAVVNNAIDWASRPFGQGALKGKPVAVVGASAGQYGGQWAHADTRKSAKVAGAQVVDSIELAHQYPWGSDPAQDAATVQQFSDAVAKLAAHEVIAG